MRYSYWASSGEPWAEIHANCAHAEATGWDGVWVPDHFMAPPEGYGPEEDLGKDPELAPVLEAWTMLAALGASVPRVTLGAMVTGNTYRHPAVVANMAATIDHISGGRLIVGMGAGWQENEHTRYGLELAQPGPRSDQFEEACEVLKLLFSQERTTFDGVHYQLDGAPCEPKPLQQPLPLMIGGGGEQRTLRTVARFADQWNIWGRPDDLRHKIDILERHCADVGRDPDEIHKTATGLLVITETDAHADKIRENVGHRGGFVGTIAQLRDIVADYAAAGVGELIVPDFAMGAGSVADTLDRFRAEVIDAVA